MTYDSSNIFAKILRGEIPAERLYEDTFAIAIRDIAPAAKVHVLVLPKGEYRSFDDFVANAPGGAQAGFWAAVRQVAHEQGLHDGGYRLIANHGPDASQSVPHFHVHILGGQALGALLPGDTISR